MKEGEQAAEKDNRAQADGNEIVAERQDSRASSDNAEIPKNAVENTKNFARRFIASPFNWVVNWLDSHNGLLTAVATLAIALLTQSLAHDSAEQARISNGQLALLRGQLDEAKQTRINGNQSMAEQLAVMRTQAAAMQAQAEASKIAAETSKLGSTAAQRAWLGPTDASLDKLPAVGGDITMTANYANTGREPAINVFRELRPFKVKADFSNGSNGAGSELLKATIAECRRKLPATDGQVAWPTNNGPGVALKTRTTMGALDDLVNDSDSDLVGIGCLAYVSYGEVRHTAFCYFLEKKDPRIDHLSICQGGNYAD